MGTVEVCFQVLLPEKCLAALAAREPPVVGVRPLVTPHLRVGPEASVAIAALERLLAGVRPRVGHKQRLDGKGALAPLELAPQLFGCNHVDTLDVANQLAGAEELAVTLGQQLQR